MSSSWFINVVMFPDPEESFLSSVIAAVVLFGSHSVAHGSLGLLFFAGHEGLGGRSFIAQDGL